MEDDKVYIVQWKYNWSGSSVVVVLPNQEMAQGYIDAFGNGEMYYEAYEVLVEF
jgi:hypothetical protein